MTTLVKIFNIFIYLIFYCGCYPYIVWRGGFRIKIIIEAIDEEDIFIERAKGEKMSLSPFKN